MCLSTVYEVRDGEEKLACEYVSMAYIQGDGVIVVDITGQEQKIKGRIKSIDLVKNALYIGSE